MDQSGVFGGLLTSLVVLYAGGKCNTLLFLLTPCFCSQLFRSGSWFFWSSCILLSIICPNYVCRTFLVLYSFFVFCCSRETSVQGQALQKSFSGPSSQPISQGTPCLTLEPCPCLCLHLLCFNHMDFLQSCACLWSSEELLHIL